MRLLWDRRFAGLFWTQLLGAFNDNFFKNALLILVVYKGLSAAHMDEKTLSAVAFGTFMLPFFLFSATAGQLADKLEKSGLVQNLKLIEVGLAGLATAGLLLENFSMLLGVLLVLGFQATFFGPVKYGILPQLVEDEELVSANALVETGTKVAILLGTILGGLIAALAHHGPLMVSIGMLVVAICGWLASRSVPACKAADPALKPQWNPITPTISILKVARQNRSVFLSILGISWFWLIGGFFLTLFPAYGKEVLHANAHVVTLFLATFCLGVGIGAVLCQRFSYDRLELGLVPFGSLGITLCAADLAVVGSPWPATVHGLMGVSAFLARPEGRRILLDLLTLAVFSGFFIIPLNTMIQQRSETRVRSRVIAGNNVMNALFMVFAAVAQVLMTRAGLSIPAMFGILALMNALVALYIYGLIPEFFLRFLAYLLAHVVYRLRCQGLQAIPREGPAVLVCNHVSFADWLVVAAAIRRPVRFVMWYTYFDIPIIRYLFRDARVIPIASSRADANVLERAYERIAEELSAGELVCIFPEGGITADGEMGEFKPGVERIVARTPVPVVPMALRGLWGSVFSRFGGGVHKRLFRREFRSRIGLVSGAPVPAEEVSATELRRQVLELRGDDR